MRVSRLFVRPIRLFAIICCALSCAASSRAQLQTTTITGTVYAPNTTDPLPNILVYVATPGAVVAPFAAGPGASCGNQNAVVSGSPLVSTTTDYKGNFSLTSSALNTLSSVNLVIQAGKWRRQYANTAITGGGTTPVGNLYMPANASQGDLPTIAVVTGAVDAVECILQQMGISGSEVTDVGGAGHINFFQGTQSPGAKATSSSTTTEAQLMTNSSLLNGYDMLMLGCQGTATDPTVTNAATASTVQGNLLNYADIGGRVFATHYEYVWLDKAGTFAAAAKWGTPTGNSITPTSSGTGTITVDTSYPEGVTLANWLQYIGASPAGTAGYAQIPNVQNVRQDQEGVIPPTQSWGTLDPPYDSQAIGTPVMQFSFDTPLNATTTPTVTMAFTNTPANFLVGDAADTIAINVVNNSGTAADPSLTLKIALPAGLTPVGLAGTNASTGWACNAPTLTCNRTGYLNAGVSDPVTLTVAVSPTAPLGTASVTGTLSGGGLSGTNQCGRVLYNEYHVEPPKTTGNAGAVTFPNECNTATFSAAEKFLEFSLYNLSNFVAPTTQDSIVILAQPPLSWTPPAPIYYGQPLDSTVLDATSTIPGTFSYNPAPGTVLAAGTYTLTATYTPTDATHYTGGTISVPFTVLPDPTVSTIDSLDQEIFYGQEIGYDNGIDAILNTRVQSPPGYNIAVTGGPFSATVDGIAECTGIEGTPITGGSRAGTCPDSGFLGWNAGVHLMQLVYGGSQNFLASSSPAYKVLIDPDPTTTSITVPQTTIQQGTSLTLSSTVADKYTAAIGPVTFYDSIAATPAVSETLPNVNPVSAGMTAIGSASVSAASQTATLTLTNFIPGAHNISACFTSLVNTSGTYNYLNSCSASVPLAVTMPASNPAATATTLTSSANPSIAGQTVTFTAVVGTTGAIVQTPAGTVNFYDGTTLLGTGTVGANGAAQYSTSALTQGTHNITAAFAGSSTLAASTSAVLAQVVNAPFTTAGNGFTLIVTPTTVPVYVGSNAIVTVQIVPLTNFSQAVQLTCGGLPAQASCSFAETTIAAGGGTTQMLVSSAAPHDCNNGTPYFATLGGRGTLALLGLGTLTLLLARRRRLLQGIALAVLLCALPTALTGCGTGSCTDFGVKPGDYSFTLTATPTGSTPAQTQAMTMHVHL